LDLLSAAREEASEQERELVFASSEPPNPEKHDEPPAFGRAIHEPTVAMPGPPEMPEGHYPFAGQTETEQVESEPEETDVPCHEKPDAAARLRRTMPARKSGVKLLVMVVVLLLVLVFILGGLYALRKMGYLGGETVWRELRSDEGRFVVLMPGEPVPRTARASDQSATGYSVIWRRPRLGFHVDFFACQDTRDPAKLLNELRPGIVEVFPGGKIQKETGLVKPCIGREYCIALSNDLRVRRRVYIGDHRVYLLTVSGLQMESATASIERFFDSFQIVA
jgi:hypothetical protein